MIRRTIHRPHPLQFDASKQNKLLDTKRDWGPKNQNEANLKAEGCLSDHPWALPGRGLYCQTQPRVHPELVNFQQFRITAELVYTDDAKKPREPSNIE